MSTQLFSNAPPLAMMLAVTDIAALAAVIKSNEQ